MDLPTAAATVGDVEKQFHAGQCCAFISLTKLIKNQFQQEHIQKFGLDAVNRTLVRCKSKKCKGKTIATAILVRKILEGSSENNAVVRAALRVFMTFSTLPFMAKYNTMLTEDQREENESNMESKEEDEAEEIQQQLHMKETMRSVTRLLIEALKRYQKDRVIQRQGLRTGLNLSVAPDLCEVIIDCGGGSLAVETIYNKHIGNDARLVEAGLGMISNLAHRNPDMFLSKFGDLNGEYIIYCIIETMERFDTKQSVQMWGANALVNVIICDNAAKSAAVRSEFMINLMMRYTDSASIQKFCIMSIVNCLIKNQEAVSAKVVNENREHLNSLGTKALVKQAVWNFDLDEMICSWGNTALKLLDENQ